MGPLGFSEFTPFPPVKQPTNPFNPSPHLPFSPSKTPPRPLTPSHPLHHPTSLRSFSHVRPTAHYQLPPQTLCSATENPPVAKTPLPHPKHPSFHRSRLLLPSPSSHFSYPLAQPLHTHSNPQPNLTLLPILATLASYLPFSTHPIQYPLSLVRFATAI